MEQLAISLAEENDDPLSIGLYYPHRNDGRQLLLYPTSTYEGVKKYNIKNYLQTVKSEIAARKEEQQEILKEFRILGEAIPKLVAESATVYGELIDYEFKLCLYREENEKLARRLQRACMMSLYRRFARDTNMEMTPEVEENIRSFPTWAGNNIIMPAENIIPM